MDEGEEALEEEGVMAKRSGGTSSADPLLLAQVRESFGRVVYSHKTHEKQADLCFKKHRWQNGILVVFTAISTGTFATALLASLVTPEVAGLLTSFVALVVTALTLATKNFKFGEEAVAHRETAYQLWNIRESYISLISDLMSGSASDAAGRERRDALQSAVGDVYSLAPRTTSRAFQQARAGLKDQEELTFSSAEIDLFLPEQLRLDKKATP